MLVTTIQPARADAAITAEYCGDKKDGDDPKVFVFSCGEDKDKDKGGGDGNIGV
ncbi:MAG: hypothetical protein JXR76_17200 [Deltaproteobacteria bacterium]|nr:hypothetical protein [Deltaproteobacteria bacterium]